MKVVFSRKGFDSASGGEPSPIVNGRPISMPIPARDRSDTTYGDLGLGPLVEKVTKGKITASSLCHCDPMFEAGRCAFGQTGTAQSHLFNNDIDIGDVFLFFGLFSNVDGSNRHHRIFAYLQVEDVMKPGSEPTFADQPYGFTTRHPHTLGEWNENNTIYVGPGYAVASDSSELRLTVPDGPVSRWQIPQWLHDTGLSYHRNSERWLPDGTLRAVARGQEFVTEISRNRAAAIWVENVLDLITENAVLDVGDE